MSSPEPTAAPGLSDAIGDLVRSLSRSAGFTVRTWDATENGDERDSYYWCHLSTPSMQSSETFPTADEAWLDCCSAAGVLDPFHASVIEAGCSIGRQGGFLSWFWYGAGGAANGPFAHPTEAIAACILANELHVRALHTPDIELAPPAI